MNGKGRYYQILGIAPTSDKSVIKRAYRKKAFHCHPDRNASENAAREFIELTEAYEILMDDNWGQRRTVYQKSEDIQKSAEEELRERMAKAKARYYESKRREREEDEAYYQSLVSGRKGRRFKYYAILSAVFGLIWLVDLAFLPAHSSYHIINEFEYTKLYIYLNLNNESYAFSIGEMASVSNSNTIETFVSPLFNDLKYVYAENHANDLMRVVPKLSFAYFFPFIQLVFLIPLCVYIFRRRSPAFILLYLVSKYMISILLLVAVFSRFRIFQPVIGLF